MELAVATAEGLFYPLSSGPADFAGHEVASVVAPAGDLWAIVKRREVWKGSRGSWDQLTSNGDDLKLNCLAVANDAALVGTERARLYRLDDRVLEPMAGFDSAPDRAEWYTPWGGPPDVRSLAVQDGEILANVHVGGILRSQDDGINWVPTIDIHSDVHEVTTGPNGLILAATAFGLATSRDRGATWDLDEGGLHASYARAVALCDSTIIMSASVGPHGGRAAIYRRDLDSDAGFVRCEDGLPEWIQDNIDTGCIATDGANAAFATSDGRVFYSEDAGRSWSKIASGLPPARWLTFF